MRCNPWRWLWGLLPIAIWTWITVLGVHETIENDLRRRTEEALAQAGLGWASATFQGRDAILSGQAFEDSQPAKALDVAHNIWGVRVAQSRADLVDKVDTYVWQAALKDSTVKITGFVPDDATRKAIIGVAKAAFSKLEIDDRMKLARGVPPRESWLGGISFALKQLSGLKKGNVSLKGTDLLVAGEAQDFASYKALKSALLNNVPQGVRLVVDRVTPPVVSPFTWSAKLANGQVVLGGHVPDETLRERVLADAKAAFPEKAVVDGTEIAGGAAEGWQQAVALSVAQLARLLHGAAAISDNELTISGRAADQPTAEAVRAALKDGVPPNFRVVDNIKAPKIATVSPFVTIIDAAAGRIELSGYAPSERARAVLVDRIGAELPGTAIAEALQIGAGAAEGWEQCLAAGASSLGKLQAGRVELTGRYLVIRGEADGEAAVEALGSEVKAAVGQLCEVDVRIARAAAPEPDLTWRASHEAGEVVLEGEAPDAGSKALLVARAARQFPSAQVVDRMTVSEIRPGTWPKVADDGLRLLSMLRRGEAVLKGQSLTVRGEAPDAGTASAVEDELRQGPAKGYSGTGSLTIRTDAMIAEELQAARKAGEAEAENRSEQPDAASQVAAVDPERQVAADRCQELMNSIAKAGTIHFDWASAELDPKSLPTLDQLAKVADVCPAASIKIEGHTDAEGTPERNGNLSQRRAEAVVHYLTSAGVPQSRLSAVGYGETRPVAPNDTPENRAKNRRIEFVVGPE